MKMGVLFINFSLFLLNFCFKKHGKMLIYFLRNQNERYLKE